VSSPVDGAWIAPLGHERTLRGLLRAASGGRLPHALLFTGPSGVGKFAAARWLACALFCNGEDAGARPCGRCAGCRQFDSGNHLDSYAVDDADDETIRMRKIRVDAVEPEPIEAERFLATRAALGGWRVLLFRDADRMNVQTQNAALKMLEEPGERVLWILTTARGHALLPTVRSRCVVVPFESLDARTCADVLVRLGVPGDEALLLAGWSRGSPGRALALRARSAATLRSELCAVFAGRTPPLEAARALMQVEGEFAGSTPLQQARDRARTVLEIALELGADAHRRACGSELDRLAHRDWLESLPETLLAPRAAALPRKLEALLETRADIDKNLDPQSLLDRACLALAP
jgi:DNA polymerase III delta' subunit